jgi:hypothetical protein
MQTQQRARHAASSTIAKIYTRRHTEKLWFYFGVIFAGQHGPGRAKNGRWDKKAD